MERVQLFLEANEIKREKYIAVLLNSIGIRTHTILQDVLTPEAQRDKSFDELVDALKRHFKPKPLVIAERFKFHRCNQARGNRCLRSLQC